jgi:hypothetical protein
VTTEDHYTLADMPAIYVRIRELSEAEAAIDAVVRAEEARIRAPWEERRRELARLRHIVVEESHQRYNRNEGWADTPWGQRTLAAPFDEVARTRMFAST